MTIGGNGGGGAPLLDDGEAIRAMYARRLGCFRDGPVAQGWISRRTQRARFQALLDVVPDPADLRGASLLDVGCGIGDLYAYLQEKDEQTPGGCVATTVRYCGVDFTPSMLARAQRRFPSLSFVLADVTDTNADLPPADYVLASGLFSYMSEAGIHATVQRLWGLARRAVAFNALSALAPEKDTTGGFFFADPAALFRFCRTLTPWVTLRHDYLPNDFSVYLYREQYRPGA